MSNDAPSWEMLRSRVEAGRFSPEGVEALVRAIGIVEGLLGRNWPQRQFESRGWWPGEFNLLGFHVAALPKFLTLALQMKAAAEEPTFGTVLQDVKRGVTDAGWRHVNLQLEVSRAMRDVKSLLVTFEPWIETSTKRADLRVQTRDGHEFLVEATSLARSDKDLDDERLIHGVWQSLMMIEALHEVRIDAQLADDVDPGEIESWLESIGDAAVVASERAARQSIESEVGRAEIWPAGVEPARVSYRGGVRTKDGWYRLGRVAHRKAVQSAGDIPVWLRIDAVDGFFQLTEWPALEWSERIARVSEALRRDLAGFGHVSGVVLSSSPAVSIGATQASVEDEMVRTELGVGIRRLIGAHVLRETVVVPLRDDGVSAVAAWTTAYSREQQWLVEDLATASMPQLQAFKD